MPVDLLQAYDSELTGLLGAAESPRPGAPAWLAELRARALAAHREQGVPTPKHEEWKYTPLKPLLGVDFRPAAPHDLPAESLDSLVLPGDLRIVFVNGNFAPALSRLPSVPGLTLAPLGPHLPALEGRFGALVPLERNTFAALSTALFGDGALIHIARNTRFEPLIQVLHVTTGSEVAAAPRVLLVAEEGSRAAVVETYASFGAGPNLTLPVTEAFLAPGACVEHLRVQREAETAFHIGLWAARLARDAQYLTTNVALGGAIARLDHNVALAGRSAETRMDGVVVARGRQLIDNHTRLDHAEPNGTSVETYRQVVADNATCVFSGKIVVALDAQRTDAHQTSKALLLSPHATMNSKPQLEIFADDVKCTHGATVGQIDEEALFYLQSRGIPAPQAQAMLVEAFAGEVLRQVADDGARTALAALLLSRLSD